MENVIVKDWYENTFPKDDMGSELIVGTTFKDVYTTLNDQEDVYNTLGVGDSIIRERVFEKLSELLNVEYRHVYDLWLGI